MLIFVSLLNGCQGESGAYSEKSLRELLGTEVVAVAQESFEDAFKAVRDKPMCMIPTRQFRVLAKAEIQQVCAPDYWLQPAVSVSATTSSFCHARVGAVVGVNFAPALCSRKRYSSDNQRSLHVLAAFCLRRRLVW